MHVNDGGSLALLPQVNPYAATAMILLSTTIASGTALEATSESGTRSTVSSPCCFCNQDLLITFDEQIVLRGIVVPHNGSQRFARARLHRDIPDQEISPYIVGAGSGWALFSEEPPLLPPKSVLRRCLRPE